MRTLTPAPNRKALLQRYNRNRERTAQLFSLVSDEAYYSRPIARGSSPS